MKSGVKEPGSGTIYFPGRSPEIPADLSAAQGLHFFARGDGGTYRVIVMTSRDGKPQTSTRTFVAGPAWQPHSFRWSDFGNSDGSAVQRILIIAGPSPGRYELFIDDIAIK